jgi:hypothetical protein
MPAAVRNYVAELNAAVGQGWNRFWFTPTAATTLGKLRVATGLLAIYAVATYAPDLERWFGAGGMLPHEMIEDLYRPDWQWLGQRSLLDFTPDSLLWPFYWLSIAVLAAYTVGLGGRAIAIAATVVTISFFARAPLVTGEFEPILVLLLVYLCIGRASDEFSLAKLLRNRSASGELSSSSLQPPASSLLFPFNTTSLRLIQVHIALVHAMIGFAQLAAGESAWWSGEGIWLAAARPGMSLVDLSGLADQPRIVAAWSHAITLYLLAFPVLIWNRLTRPLVLVAGVLAWASFAVASGWVMFALAMLTGLAAFIEPRATFLPPSPAGRGPG